MKCLPGLRGLHKRPQRAEKTHIGIYSSHRSSSSDSETFRVAVRSRTTPHAFPGAVRLKWLCNHTHTEVHTHATYKLRLNPSAGKITHSD